MAAAIPGRASTGVVLPLLIFADLIAASMFREHVQWALLRRLAWPICAGRRRGLVAADGDPGRGLPAAHRRHGARDAGPPVRATAVSALRRRLAALAGLRLGDGAADRSLDDGGQCRRADRVDLPHRARVRQARVRPHDGVAVPVREPLQGPVRRAVGSHQRRVADAERLPRARGDRGVVVRQARRRPGLARACSRTSCSGSPR